MTWQVANEPQAVRRLARKIEREAPGPVRVCYEAGPCGYALQRQLTTTHVTCQVIAPALIPRKPGERIKTNRRDARKLAELFRAGLLTEVRPPTPEEEAVRDLCRARDDAREDLQRCRHRLSKLLLRRGLALPAGAIGRTPIADGSTVCRGRMTRSVSWSTTMSWRWIMSRRGCSSWMRRLTAIAQTAPYREQVAWLRCFRGIETLTAMLLLGELHDFRRFRSPRALMAYVGLVPSEDSSGEKHRRGRITRAGNALVGGCWWKPRGTTSEVPSSGRRSRGADRASRRGPSRLPTKRTSDSVGASAPCARARCHRRRSSWRSRASSWAFCGRRCNPGQAHRSP